MSLEKRLIFKSVVCYSSLPVSELASSPVRVNLEKVGHSLQFLVGNLLAKEGSNSFSLAFLIVHQFLVPSDPHPRVASQWPELCQLSPVVAEWEQSPSVERSKSREVPGVVVRLEQSIVVIIGHGGIPHPSSNKHHSAGQEGLRQEV